MPTRRFSALSTTLAGAALFCVALSAQAREYSVSTVLSADFPWGQAAEKWAELVEERSEGRITLRVYPNSQLVSGDQTREFSAMRQGLIDMAVGSTINWSPQVPELNLFSLPFLMPDTEAVDAITGGDAGQMVFDAIESRGVVPLAWGENGFRELSNSKLPIDSPDDLDGLKIRVVGSPLFQDTFTALGANPTQMSWADAKPALTTGAVDGQENPLSVFDVARIDQVGQKYLTLWHYMNDPLIFAVNQRVWQQLPEEDRELLRQAAVDAGQWEIEMSRDQKDERLEAIKSRGVEVIELDETQRQAFVDATQSVYESWAPEIGPDLVDAARQAVENR
ncbi:DctP family TRAP transporter solute-binding subunit [Halomonas sp. McH1-25]|uniref:DctP family TRAP transporter solute-binding subunit n=1 Tax=unclassified Halomonas TaxID=2609666 RepID=UPI001EF48F0D|nr:MULTISPECIES: DctP family TRAP transporter solute-binding subunit [unclassified Halomonas]MCG7599211.1 DctP family TRAP transporter solute-binding subunit [Halomonas sp. McH1-25]MCP1341079.1 DctP family TRAP transporter solute-binding subunit [Halomonas sp. FL8]MCP1361701.1 DctP family TRAP transporter solute-binding subunit [Halomonas sp. BBD45]MCP1364583.1 DctP family TRAP transporter solute-binding subunit [Halomonas sp. BBD48]